MGNSRHVARHEEKHVALWKLPAYSNSLCWYFEFEHVDPEAWDRAVVAPTERVCNMSFEKSSVHPVAAVPAKLEDVPVERRTSGTANAMMWN